MRWITASHLDNWPKTNSKDCQNHLPLIIRKLIQASNLNIQSLFFPAGDSVFRKGWDGMLEVNGGNALIPSGKSLWEIGTSQTPSTKADGDYGKRKTEPGVDDPSQYTYVFVTPRRWVDKVSWQQEKAKENFWKDVIVLDADDLETHLEHAPNVAIELGRKLGVLTGTVDPLKLWWTDWSEAPDPKIAPGLLVAGRDSAKAKVVEWLQSDKSELTIQASTKDEVSAFIAACIEGMNEQEKDALYSSTVKVKEESELMDFLSIQNPHIIINTTENIELNTRLTQAGHRVIQPLGIENTRNKNTLSLPLPKQEAFITALIDSKLSRKKATHLAKESGRSFSVLRRLTLPQVNQPGWAKSENAQFLIPALIAGQWDEDFEGDRAVLEEIAGKPYAEIVRKLHTFSANISDAPLYHFGKKWKLVSAFDAWVALSPFLSDQDYECLDRVIDMVIHSDNPVLGLPAEDRPFALIQGIKANYSTRIRKGLIQTLILIALHNTTERRGDIRYGQAWVNKIIYRIMERDEKQYWQTLDDIMPLLAEASPDSFLKVLDAALGKDDSAIAAVFEEDTGFLSPTSYHTGLLWGLELLAWDTTYLPRVVSILVKLNRIDPGGSLSNRPLNSLLEIFTTWKPQTLASPELRQRLIQKLIKQDKDLGWSFLTALLTKDVGFESHMPRWRIKEEILDSGLEDGVLQSEVQKGFSFCFRELISLVGDDSERWIKLLNMTNRMHPENVETLIHTFENLPEFSGNRKAFLEQLRGVISDHRSYNKTNWALPETYIKRIEAVFHRLELTDIVDGKSWLFTDLPKLLTGGDIVSEEYKQECRKQQQAVISEVWKTKDLNALERLALNVERPGLIGVILAEVVEHKDDMELLALFNSDKEKVREVIKRFTSSRSHHQSFKWAQKSSKALDAYKISYSHKAEFFDALPKNREVWNLLDGETPEVQKEYWETCYSFFFQIPLDDLIFGISKLLEADRYFDAIQCISLNLKEIELPVEIMLNVIHQTGISNKDKSRYSRLDQYNLERIFETVYKSEIKDESLTEKIEWLYSDILLRYGSKIRPKRIFSRLATEPDFFAEIVSYAFKPNSFKEGDIVDYGSLTEQEYLNRAKKTYSILNKWNTCPGQSENGEIDAEIFMQWHDQVLVNLEALDRVRTGHYIIGAMLGNTYKSSNNQLPESVCEIVERLSNEVVDRNIGAAIFNRGGVTVRAVDAGGSIERGIASGFQKLIDDTDIEYPRVASIYRSLFEDYKSRADDEDLRAQQGDFD
ncbi:MAG: hypothetical protein VYB44_08340 [Bacteroidota bacterium]|nr:hypothetical protein [Bacteroidota bacterium]